MHSVLLRKVAESRLGGGCALPDTAAAILRSEGVSLAHNLRDFDLAGTQFQLDLFGVSRQICRLFGSSVGGSRDAFATIEESPVSRWDREGRQSSPPPSPDTKSMDGAN